MVEINGACHKCGRMTSVSFDTTNTNTNTWSDIPELLCASCHSKYYSEEAVRDAKLEKLLKKSIWSKIRDFIRVVN